MKPGALILILVLFVPPLRAQSDTDAVLLLRESRQREWIADSRAKYREDLAAREIACYQRFAVYDCLSASRQLQNELLADLRRQEILINDTQRKRRAARQMLRSDEKSAGTP